MKYVFYWFEEAKISLDVAKSLYKSKKYAETLFFGHLTLEKILKSIVVFQTNKHAPFTHDLVSLAEKGRMPLLTDAIETLQKVNGFYLSGRYDQHKMDFRKKCTPEFTKKYFDEIKNTYIWLEKEAQTLFRSLSPQKPMDTSKH